MRELCDFNKRLAKRITGTTERKENKETKWKGRKGKEMKLLRTELDWVWPCGRELCMSTEHWTASSWQSSRRDHRGQSRGQSRGQYRVCGSVSRLQSRLCLLIVVATVPSNTGHGLLQTAVDSDPCQPCFELESPCLWFWLWWSGLSRLPWTGAIDIKPSGPGPADGGNMRSTAGFRDCSVGSASLCMATCHLPDMLVLVDVLWMSHGCLVNVWSTRG